MLYVLHIASWAFLYYSLYTLLMLLFYSHKRAKGRRQDEKLRNRSLADDIH